MGNFAENLNLGNRFRPPPDNTFEGIMFSSGPSWMYYVFM